MHINGSILVLFLFMALGFIACDDGDEPNDKNLIVLDGIIRIQDTFEIKKGKEVLIKPGSEITFSSGALFIAHGNLIIEGTKDKPIILIAEDPIGDHIIIAARKDCEKFKLKHVEVNDGLVTSLSKDNHFRYVTFRNSKELEWNNAAARFWYGNVLIEDCVVEWNNQGEGFLLHNIEAPIIQNCTFKRIPDAIEYIHCNNGKILGNQFQDMNDDAVDQNHCHNTLIKDNTFFNVKDKALELGSEKFGSSDSLIVTNNLFVNCKVGINVKESSFARIENATFYNNEIGLDIHTHADSSRISRVEMLRSVVVQNGIAASVNARSEAILSDCLSDKPLPIGSNNVVSSVEFGDPHNFDFTIIESKLPKNETVTSMGFQNPK